MYLKRKYGEGYNLIVELKSDENEFNSIKTKNSLMNSMRFVKVTEFLRTYMLDIGIKEQHGDQITYVLLDDAEHTKIFPTMLAELDATKEKYHIKSYGLSNSSLEQVFLRVADEIKRPEDYQRLSTWKKIQNRIKNLFKKNEAENTTNENDNDDDQIQMNSGLSGKIMNMFKRLMSLY
jgi:hypothetical protein